MSYTLFLQRLRKTGKETYQKFHFGTKWGYLYGVAVVRHRGSPRNPHLFDLLTNLGCTWDRLYRKPLRQWDIYILIKYYQALAVLAILTILNSPSNIGIAIFKL